MNLGGARPALLIAALGALAAACCLLAMPLLGGDPLLAIEVSGIVSLAGWTVLAARDLAGGYALARRLDERSEPVWVAGVTCRVIHAGGRHAFVLGAIRPTIYLGDALLAALDGEELQAVLLHEDYHRRTRAPLRSIAIDGWLALVGRWQPARAALVDRLTDLEEAADADALRRGVTPAALAGALLKSDPSPAVSGTAFAAAAERRLRTLLAHADGIAVTRSTRLPYEWLPAAAVVVVTFACHMNGTQPWT